MTDKKSFKEKISAIQTELKAPKGQYNNFGKYKYRSCEDILEAVKPLLNKYRVILNLRDEIIEVGGRVYIKATATITDIDSVEFLENTAWAREDEAKKGMDGSQITGTASSYARKYCLNGLFLIDDTKDADTDEYHKTTNGGSNKITEKDAKAIRTRLDKNNVDEEALCKQYGIKTIEEMTIEMMNRLNDSLNKIEKG